MTDGLTDCLLGLAAIAHAERDLERAARLLGASESLRHTLHQPVAPIDRDDYEHTVAAIRASLQAPEHEAALEAGRAMTLDDAFAEVLTS